MGNEIMILQHCLLDIYMVYIFSYLPKNIFDTQRKKSSSILEHVWYETFSCKFSLFTFLRGLKFERPFVTEGRKTEKEGMRRKECR